MLKIKRGSQAGQQINSAMFDFFQSNHFILTFRIK
jgi:hypothetical protein